MANTRFAKQTEEFKPNPPMTACAKCKKDAETESEMFILVEGAWYCRRCFFEGPGRRWPRPRRRR